MPKKPLIIVTFSLFLFLFCSNCSKECKIRPNLEKIGESAVKNKNNLSETELKAAQMSCKF